LPGGLNRCLRLGNSEFLVEADSPSGVIERIRTQADAAAGRAWCVLRTDYCALIGGTDMFGELSRIASFDFPQLLHAPDRVVMTLLAGISVTVVMEDANAPAPQLRLWADASFGTYLEHTLHSLHGEPA
jgi:sarcosine oxidase subunit gamma